MKKFIVLMILVFCLVSMVSATSAEPMPWESGLTKIMKSLSGPTAKIIGVILIVGAGIAVAATEGQAIKKLLWIVVGMGVALNAASFLATLFGNGSGAIYTGGF